MLYEQLIIISLCIHDCATLKSNIHGIFEKHGNHLYLNNYGTLGWFFITLQLIILYSRQTGNIVQGPFNSIFFKQALQLSERFSFLLDFSYFSISAITLASVSACGKVFNQNPLL
ncbi:hypothetical protein pb186bvf_009930 [Paramecium bursaria]